MTSKFCRNVILLICFKAISYSRSLWIRSGVHHGWTLNTADGVLVAANDPTECLRRCFHLHFSKCLAVSFNESAIECWHFTSRLVVLVGSSDDLMILTEWATDMYIDFDMPYAEGEEQCRSLGGRVMSRAEIDDAFIRGDGVIDCRCGWVNDGVTQLIVRWANGNCSSIHVGVKECQPGHTMGKTWCTQRRI